VRRVILNHTRCHARTHAFGRLRTRDRPDAETSTCTTHKIHSRQTWMPLAGLEPAVPSSERPQTHTLDRAATGIGCFSTYDLRCPQGLSSQMCFRVDYHIYTIAGAILYHLQWALRGGGAFPRGHHESSQGMHEAVPPLFH